MWRCKPRNGSERSDYQMLNLCYSAPLVDVIPDRIFYALLDMQSLMNWFILTFFFLMVGEKLPPNFSLNRKIFNINVFLIKLVAISQITPIFDLVKFLTWQLFSLTKNKLLIWRFILLIVLKLNELCYNRF